MVLGTKLCTDRSRNVSISKRTQKKEIKKVVDRTKMACAGSEEGKMRSNLELAIKG